LEGFLDEKHTCGFSISDCYNCGWFGSRNILLRTNTQSNTYSYAECYSFSFTDAQSDTYSCSEFFSFSQSFANSQSNAYSYSQFFSFAIAFSFVYSFTDT
jgi:hypothetical protein